MSQKIVISKPGFNVLTTTDPNNLIYSSDYPTLIYYTSGTFDFGNTTATSGSMNIEHNLGYRPFFLVYTNFGAPDPAQFFMCPFYFDDGGGGFGYAYAFADELELICRFDRAGTGSINPIFHYKIFRNNANP
jgi:hypothetical protein